MSQTSAGFDPTAVKALTFDVFGTVVNWRLSVSRAAAQLARRHGIELDAPAFADAWRSGYPGKLAEINSGARPRRRLNDLHREILAEIAPAFGLQDVPGHELDRLNLTWHRLLGWPDSAPGLWRLRQRYLVCALSNGDSDMLATMGKFAGLNWDLVISVELAGAYKPKPAAYQKAIELVDAAPHQVLMVAAHTNDLAAAQACGMRTAYIHRPAEWGRDDPPGDSSRFDIAAPDLIDLALRLGV